MKSLCACAQIKAAADAEVRARMEAALKERLAQDAADRCGAARRAALQKLLCWCGKRNQGDRWGAGRKRS